jgi:hypothetical protein
MSAHRLIPARTRATAGGCDTHSRQANVRGTLSLAPKATGMRRPCMPGD